MGYRDRDFSSATIDAIIRELSGDGSAYTAFRKFSSKYEDKFDFNFSQDMDDIDNYVTELRAFLFNEAPTELKLIRQTECEIDEYYGRRLKESADNLVEYGNRIDKLNDLVRLDQLIKIFNLGPFNTSKLLQSLSQLNKLLGTKGIKYNNNGTFTLLKTNDEKVEARPIVVTEAIAGGIILAVLEALAQVLVLALFAVVVADILLAESKADTKEEEKDGTDEEEKKIGENGTQTSSTTTGRDNNGNRINVENGSPGKRDGNIHIHYRGKKYYWDFGKKLFIDSVTKQVAPASIQKLINLPWVQKALRKACEILGEIW